MKRRISGDELRDKMLSRIKREEDSEPTEETRIQALSPLGNRELLQIIATKQPRSISELAILAGRLQPNVSRSLSALARAGLLTVTQDGRASVPTLTPEGRRKAEDLRFVEPALMPSAPAETSSPLPIETPFLSAIIVGAADGDLETDSVQANVVMRIPTDEARQAFTAHTLLNLNEVCTNLLANWWRILYRRDNPYKMFFLEKENKLGVSHATLLAVSAGRIELLVRSMAEDRKLWAFPHTSLTAEDFTALVLNELVRPLVHRLRTGKRFDRPVESMLRRTVEILGNPDDFTFWKSAGALGMSYQNMNDAAADNVTLLINAISNEEARLDFASVISPDQLRQTLKWVGDEVTAKAKMNGLPKLNEFQRGTGIGASGLEPWRIGTERARDVRRKIGLAQDRPVGGLSGLAQIFSGDDKFVPSAASEQPLRGFLSHRDDIPVVVVRNEGSKSTAFLMSRAIGDYLVYGSREAPIADIYSDRQAIGRAFAAEFMAPAQGVIHMIEEEQAPLVTVAEHYGVDLGVVRRQYENNIAQYASAA